MGHGRFLRIRKQNGRSSQTSVQHSRSAQPGSGLVCEQALSAPSQPGLICNSQPVGSPRGRSRQKARSKSFWEESCHDRPSPMPPPAALGAVDHSHTHTGSEPVVSFWISIHRHSPADTTTSGWVAENSNSARSPKATGTTLPVAALTTVAVTSNGPAAIAPGSGGRPSMFV